MEKRVRAARPLLPLLASASGPSLIKHLASCNTTVRSQSLRLLQSWLQSDSSQLSDSDIKKLWKGLFYCLWHSDKTPNQVALIEKLTSLFVSLHPSLSLEFFRGFLVTLRREWSGIDRLRLDKFYLLIRRFIKTLFELMRLRKWDSEVLGGYFGILEKCGLIAEDKVQGNGVNYHIVSVFMEELKGVGFPVRKEVTDVIFGPFFAVLLRSKDKILVGKVKSCLFEEILNAGKQILEKKKMKVDCDETSWDFLLGVVALKMSFAEKFYSVSSSAECVQGNRKVCLEFHGDFLKLEKAMLSSAIELELPEYNDAGCINGSDDSEVPLLIPIENISSNDGIEPAPQEGSEDAHEDMPQSKKKRKNKGMDADGKKVKSKKKKGGNREAKGEVCETNSLVNEDVNMVTDDGMENPLSPSNDLVTLGNEVVLNEIVIANLQKQFEKVASEEGDSFSNEDLDFGDTPVRPGMRVNKRKRRKEAEVEDSTDVIDAAPAVSVDKSAKKVRFSMKNNLVWKPQTPLPPQNLRLPPSVTPRGSALKKGVPPGPVIETPPSKKKANRRKKAQKRLKSTTPVIKKRKKISTRSA